MARREAQRLRPVARRSGAFPLPRWGIVVEAVLLALMLILGIIIRTHADAGPLPGDVPVALDVQHALPPHSTQADAIDLISTVTWPIQSLIIDVVVGILLLALRRRLDAIILLGADGLSSGANYLIALAVHRARPSDHGLYIAQHLTVTYSYPSGHVLHGVVFFGLALFMSFQVRREHAWLWIPRAVLFVFAVFMGPSRIAEGEHWPSDVLGALLFGLFWLLLGIAFYRRAAVRWPRLRGTAAPV